MPGAAVPPLLVEGAHQWPRSDRSVARGGRRARAAVERTPPSSLL